MESERLEYQGRVAQWVETLQSELEGSWFKTCQALRQAQELNFIMRLPVTFGLNLYKCSDQHQVSEAVPLRMAQSWLWDTQIAFKKKSSEINMLLYSYILVRMFRLITEIHKEMDKVEDQYNKELWFDGIDKDFTLKHKTHN